MPSSVSTSWPETRGMMRAQESSGEPSTSTVQRPQFVVSQAHFTLLIPCFLSQERSVSAGSALVVTGRPLRVKAISMLSLIVHPL